VRLQLVAALPSADRCVFRADHALPRVVPDVRSVSTLSMHERIYAFGFPAATPTLSAGRFTNVYIDDDGVRMIETNARADHGSSGGALFDRFGNLVGIVREAT
jgi:serine protease Do